MPRRSRAAAPEPPKPVPQRTALSPAGTATRPLVPAQMRAWLVAKAEALEHAADVMLTECYRMDDEQLGTLGLDVLERAVTRGQAYRATAGVLRGATGRWRSAAK